MYMHFILDFKVIHLIKYMRIVSTPKHVAYIDKTNKTFFVVDRSTYVNFDMIYHNGMNSTKIEGFDLQRLWRVRRDRTRFC
jgi:coproporphyrinogen III oxidase